MPNSREEKKKRPSVLTCGVEVKKEEQAGQQRTSCERTASHDSSSFLRMQRCCGQKITVRLKSLQPRWYVYIPRVVSELLELHSGQLQLLLLYSLPSFQLRVFLTPLTFLQIRNENTLKGITCLACARSGDTENEDGAVLTDESRRILRMMTSRSKLSITFKSHFFRYVSGILL